MTFQLEKFDNRNCGTVIGKFAWCIVGSVCSLFLQVDVVVWRQAKVLLF